MFAATSNSTSPTGTVVMERAGDTPQKPRSVQYRPVRSNANFTTGGGRGNHKTRFQISKEM